MCAYILLLFALDSENFRIPLALAIGLFGCAYILSLFALDSENFRIPLAPAIGKRDGLAVENLTKFTAV